MIHDATQLLAFALKSVKQYKFCLFTASGEKTAKKTNHELIDMQRNNIKLVTVFLLAALFVFQFECQTINLISRIGGREFLGDNGVANGSALFYVPHSLALDETNNLLYISDSKNNKIRRLNITSNVVTSLCGTGRARSSGDGGACLQAEIYEPGGLALDLTNNLLYFAEQDGNKIRMLNMSNNIVSTLAGTGTAGDSGENGLASLAKLSSPSGIALDAQNNVLFLADRLNNKIKMVNLATKVITTVVGTGSSTFNGDGLLGPGTNIFSPRSLSYDIATSNLYFIDLNCRIRAYNRASVIVSTIVGTGVCGSGGDNGLATAAQVSTPQGLYFDAPNNMLYIGDDKLRRVNMTTGIITTYAGSSTTGYSGDGGTALGATFFFIYGMLVHSNMNTLFLCDGNNFAIRVINLQTNIVQTIAGPRLFENYAIAPNTNFFYPNGLDFDKNRNVLYIGDQLSSRIRMYNATSNEVTTIAGIAPVYAASVENVVATTTRINRPSSVLIDSSNNMLYFADLQNFRIKQINRTTNIMSTIVGGGVVLLEGVLGNTTSLGLCYGLALDSRNSILYFSDSGSSRIRMIDLNTKIVLTIVGNGTVAFSGDGGPGLQATVSNPNGLAFDETTNMLYVADRTNNRIRAWNRTSDIVTTIAGVGASGSTGDGALATSARLSSPAGLKLDVAKRLLFVADQSNAKVRVINLNTNIINTYAGIPIASGYGYTSTIFAAQASFTNIFDVALDNENSMYIADPLSHMVRKIYTACDRGYYRTNNTCAACPLGTYASGYDTKENCTMCPQGTYSNITTSIALSNCLPCPPFYTSYNGSTSLASCFCAPGYTGNSCQFSICYNINGSLADVCSSSGQCIAPNTCSCDDCFAGNECEFNKCILAGIALVNAQDALVSLVNNPLNVTVQYKRNIPTYLQSQVLCYANGAPLPTYFLGNLTYTCTVFSATPVLRNLLLQFFPINIISTSLPIVFLAQQDASFVFESVQVALANTSKTVQISMPYVIALPNNVLCAQQQQDGNFRFFKPSSLAPIFACNIAQTQQEANVTLHLFYNYTRLIQVSNNSSNLIVHFVAPYTMHLASTQTIFAVAQFAQVNIFVLANCESSYFQQIVLPIAKYCQIFGHQNCLPFCHKPYLYLLHSTY